MEQLGPLNPSREICARCTFLPNPKRERVKRKRSIMENLTSELLISIFLFLDYGDIFRVRRACKRYHQLFSKNEYWILRASRKLRLPDSPDFRKFFCLAPSEEFSEVDGKLTYGYEENPIELYARVLKYGCILEGDYDETDVFVNLIRSIKENDLEKFKSCLGKLSGAPNKSEIDDGLFRYLSRDFKYEIFLHLLEVQRRSLGYFQLPFPFPKLTESQLDEILNFLRQRKLVGPTFFAMMQRYRKDGLSMLSKLAIPDLYTFFGCIRDEHEINLIPNIPVDQKKNIVMNFALRTGMYEGPYHHILPTHGILGNFCEDDQICKCFEYHPGLIPLALARKKKIVVSGDSYIFSRYVWLTKAIDMGVKVDSKIFSEIPFLKDHPEIRQIILELFPFPPAPKENPRKIRFSGDSWEFI